MTSNKTLEQAARQALEALNKAFEMRVTNHPKWEELARTTIIALNQALEQKPCDMGQMCLDCQPRGANGECPDQQPKQEPVLWGCKFNKGNRLDTFYTKGAAERFVEGSLRNGADVSLVSLYTEPPLTHPLDIQRIKHIATYCGEHITDEDVIEITRRVEAAHGIGEKK